MQVCMNVCVHVHVKMYLCIHVHMMGCGGSLVVFGAFGVEGRWFESHVGTLGKSFTRCSMYDVMLRPAWLPCD